MESENLYSTTANIIMGTGKTENKMDRAHSLANKDKFLRKGYGKTE